MTPTFPFSSVKTHRDLVKYGLSQIDNDGLERIIKARKMLLDGGVYSPSAGCG